MRLRTRLGLLGLAWIVIPWTWVIAATQIRERRRPERDGDGTKDADAAGPTASDDGSSDAGADEPTGSDDAPARDADADASADDAPPEEADGEPSSSSEGGDAAAAA
jgi:hypothetical protein